MCSLYKLIKLMTVWKVENQSKQQQHDLENGVLLLTGKSSAHFSNYQCNKCMSKCLW